MKHMNTIEKYWNLQLFSEDNGDGDGANSGNNGDNGDGASDEPLSFDGFLAKEGNQAEYDKRVNKAINSALKKAESKWKALHDENISEAEKLSQMNADERKDYEITKLKNQIADYERKDAVAGLTKTARQMLSESGLNIPDALLMNLVADDAESTKASVDAFAKMYKDAVQSAVKEALKGSDPKGGAGNKITREQIEAVKNPTERRKLIAENLELFR